MESIDIISQGLKEQGYTLRIEGSTIVMQSLNGAHPYRFTIYKNDWNKTVKQIEKRLEDSSVEQFIISAIFKDMSYNHEKLMGGAVALKNKQEIEKKQGLKMAPKATRANCPMEEWPEWRI